MAKVIKIISDILFVLLIILLCLYFALRFMGIAEIYKVKTGSMEDGIHAGDYILIYKKDKYNIGDIVTYEKDNYHVTHRIIKKNGEKIITKGDANNIEDDEINVKSIVGKVIYSGGYLNFVIDYKYAIASALLALYLFSYYFSKKDDEKELLEEKNIDSVSSEEKSEEETIKDSVSSEEKSEEKTIKDSILSEEKSEEKTIKDSILSEEKSEENNKNEDADAIKKNLSSIYEKDKKIKSRKKGKKNKRK